MLSLRKAIMTAAVPLLASAMATAAQSTVNGEHDELVDHVENTLERAGWEIVDQAQTDRFTLIYAARAERSFVTVTLRQLPSTQAQVELNINTDSPKDLELEQQLLAQITNG